MATSHRFVLLLAAQLVAFMLQSSNSQVVAKTEDTEQPAVTQEQSNVDLHQVADSIVAAGKAKVGSAKTEADAIRFIRLTQSALQTVGTLGDFDTSAQTEAFFTSLQTDTRPAIADAIMQIRMSNIVFKWPTMKEKARAAALDNYLSTVKKAGLTQSSAYILMRIASMTRDGDKSPSLLTALNEMATIAGNSDDAKVKKMAKSFEGIARRLDLPGKPLEMEGTLLDGKKLDWDSYRGKVVLVDFHASWCGPCRAEVPNILKNYDAYHDKGFEVVGINMDSERSGADKYIKDTGFKFPILFPEDSDAKGWEAPLAVKYGINAIPRVLLVDKEGIVVSTNARGDDLGKKLKQLLGEPADKEAAKADTSETPAPVDPDSAK